MELPPSLASAKQCQLDRHGMPQECAHTLCSNAELRTVGTCPSLISARASEVFDIGIHRRVIILSKLCDLAYAIFEACKVFTAASHTAAGGAGRIFESQRSVWVITRLASSEVSEIEEDQTSSNVQNLHHATHTDYGSHARQRKAVRPDCETSRVCDVGKTRRTWGGIAL